MKLWHSYQELFELTRRELFTAVVGDIMDTLGLQNQFLPPQIRPLRDDMMVIGQAMTVLEADVFSAQVENSANPLMTKPFGLMFEALDDLKTGEVYICTGGSPTYALWGDLMSVRAKQLGAAGAVLDGYSRDTNGILDLNFPTFSFGAYAQDQGPRGKVIDFRVPLEIGGVKINPGDIVFADIDGVCIIPQHTADEVFAKSIEKARGEKLVRKAIESGMSASAAFKKYGIM
jgi:regulator of RNase E activity RraA